MVEPHNAGASAGNASTLVLNKAVTTPELGERELQIKMWLDSSVEFKGSAALLQAERLIPDGFDWPRAAADKRWEANGFDYWLRRTRLEGWKGAVKSWFEVDNWVVSITVTDRDYIERNRMELMRKAKELRAEFRSHTPAGRREWDANFRRYWAARNDKYFQAFKALIPRLIPPKRGRKLKTTTSGAAQ